jgi:hypothetical protein
MPFKSKSQRRWMYATHPEMARHWEEVTPKGKSLPERVKKATLRGFIDELKKISSIITRS